MKALITILLAFIALAVVMGGTPVTAQDFSCLEVSEIPHTECDALIAIYNSTNGDGWSDNTNWMVNNTPSDWSGITIADGHVTEIVLENNFLVGVIPSEVEDLHHLKILNLRWNELTGSIPEVLINLTNLQILDLMGNLLTDSIPPELGNLINLETLILRDNFLSGSIPAELGDLWNLQTLDLGLNQLTGSIPASLGNLSNLIYLDLQGVYIGEYLLTGSIPSELGNLVKLEYIDLSNNNLTGPIPASLGNLINLEHLYFANNQLTGSIPSSYGNLRNLKYLVLGTKHMGANNLSGPIPPELGNLINLEYLILVNNDLTGSIPAQLGNLINLYWLDLGSNQLSGPIPQEFGNLSRLNLLQLSQNQLTGSIPASLGDLSWLRDLSLEYNSLSGEIPSSLGNLRNLRELNIHGNQLSGSIPSEFGNLVYLSWLNLSQNLLTGPIPLSLMNLDYLNYFYFMWTTICEPDTPEFLEWKESIDNWVGTGLICGLNTYNSISGHVIDSRGNPISGAGVSSGIGYNAVTDSQGYFAIRDVADGTYEVTATKIGYTFTPNSRIVSVPPNATEVNFVGSPSTQGRSPIVFVHGFRGLSGLPIICTPFHRITPTTEAESTAYFDKLAFLLRSNYDIYFAPLISNPCYTASLRENASRLKEFIKTVPTQTGKVILIGHSMGGLVSRAYVESDLYAYNVETLITIGSPHLGVPVEVLNFLYPHSIVMYCINHGPAACEFSVIGMTNFNINHYNRRVGVNYFTISGDAPRYTLGALGTAVSLILRDPSDGTVTAASGLGLWGRVHRFPATDENHRDLGNASYKWGYFSTRETLSEPDRWSKTYTDILKPLLVDGQTPAGIDPLLDYAALQTDTPPLSKHSEFLGAMLLPDEMLTNTLPVEGGPTLFSSHWLTGEVAFDLVDPFGTVINPDYAASNPAMVTYTADENAAGYYFTDAATGEWELVLRGIDLPAEGAYVTSFAAFDSELAFSGETDRNWYKPGATAVITATLSGSTLNSATVTAEIRLSDAVSQPISLSTTGDGIYQGQYVIPAVPGYSEVLFKAQGVTGSDITFTRGTYVLFQIAPDTISLAGNYQDVSSGTPFYQSLDILTGVSVVKSGTYALSAQLVNSDGKFVAHALETTDLAVGQSTLTLHFSGTEIYASQLNGPYTLTSLLLTDLNEGALVVDNVEDVFLTQGYDYRQFGPGFSIYLPTAVKN